MRVTIEDGCIHIDRNFKGPINNMRTLLEGHTIQDLIIIYKEGDEPLSEEDKKFLLSITRPSKTTNAYVESWRYIDISKMRQVLDFPID